jgi:hypothetical protein
MIPVTFREVVRSLLAFAGFTILPGLIVVYFLYGSLRRAETIALSFGWSLGVNILIAYAVHYAGGALDHYIIGVLIFDGLGGIFLLSRLFQGEPHNPDVVTERSLYSGLVLVISLVWFGVIMQNGPRIDYEWDQWFHIAHIREVIESCRIIPPNPFWPDVPLSETYGMWHPLAAAVARSASISVTLLWRVGNAYMAALGFVVVYSIAGAYFTDKGRRLLSGVVFLASGAGALQIMRTFLYPWGSTTLLLWISLGLLFQYLKQGEWRTALSGIIIGVLPAFIHPQEYIFLCFGAFALGCTATILKLVRRGSPVVLAKIWLLFLILLIVGFPIIVLKYPERMSLVRGRKAPVTTDAHNPELEFYGHPLARMTAIIFPYYWKIGLLFHSFIPFNVITLLLSRLVARRMDDTRRWFLLTLVWVPALAVLFPGLSWLTHLVLKETYAWRLLNLIPTPFIWASVISTGILALSSSGNLPQPFDEKNAFGGKWVHSVLIFALVSVLSFFIARVVSYDELVPNSLSQKPLQFRAMFETLDRLSEEPSIVLSDPKTSYVIPGLTRHHVVLNTPSHGRRDDIMTRFVRARALLSSPYQSRETAVVILEEYEVDFVVVNKLLIAQPFFSRTPFCSDYTLDFLQGNPDCFQRVYEDDGFDVFKYLHCDPSALARKGLEPNDSVSAENIEHQVGRDVAKNLRLKGFSLPNGDSVSPGRDLTANLYWEVRDKLVEPYAVWAELLCEYPGRSLPYGRALRRVYEMIGDERLGVVTFGWLPIPASGLDRGDVLLHSLALAVPPNMREGACDLSVYVLDRRQALYDLEALPTLLMEKEQTLYGIKLKETEVKSGE